MVLAKWLIAIGMLTGAALAPPDAREGARDGKDPAMDYGACSRCSCPGFQGSGYTCLRGGCGHHYDLH